MAETILHGKTGYHMPPGDAVALAKQMAFCLSQSQEDIDHVAQAARDHVQSRFSIQVMQAKTMAVYEELLT